MKSRYHELKSKSYVLGELSLGSIQTKWKTCGDPNCKCARGEKHGPYYYLSFTDRKTGKTTFSYIHKDELSKLKGRIQNYGKFRNELRELMEIEAEMRKG
ncbi:hypothetical protein AKJ42_01965 [candidate division MSBL1 archaeon SCGC-AAA261C02]|uniref:DUF6788 domain-containing protein n=1 Tax=candidate division MSBL1 archaeon SCGC-AAA261C02 TaxID=1698272 RepID=A0A133V0R5_9EURY|nr:hypothetical protein AKJ42_01965 [candidate division MSBL1 archaeon SCGC-AAA261C02]